MSLYLNSTTPQQSKISFIGPTVRKLSALQQRHVEQQRLETQQTINQGSNSSQLKAAQDGSHHHKTTKENGTTEMILILPHRRVKDDYIINFSGLVRNSEFSETQNFLSPGFHRDQSFLFNPILTITSGTFLWHNLSTLPLIG